MRRLIAFVLLLLVMPVRAQSTLVDESSGAAYVVETYVSASFPVGMVFLPDGSLLYNEKINGRVRLVDPDGVTRREPVLTVPVSALQERGMLGLTIAPDFAGSGLVYVVFTREGTARDWPANELIRFRLVDGIVEDVETLLSVPIDNGELLHNGGNVHFDADGYLFLSLGDYGEAANAQDLTTPQGAIHRFEVTDEGLIPAAGNPFGDDNSIYAYGLRNAFDFTFDPQTNRLFTVEVGPNCDDELNLVLPGFNYGWGPDYECVGKDVITGLTGIYAQPLLSFTPVIAPTGIAFYEADAFPEWQGDLFMCDWITGTMRRLELDEARTRITAEHIIDLGGTQCRIDLVVGPDGALYFGTVDADGGAILRLRPAE